MALTLIPGLFLGASESNLLGFFLFLMHFSDALNAIFHCVQLKLVDNIKIVYRLQPSDATIAVSESCANLTVLDG